jgi:hypothetical protein
VETHVRILATIRIVFGILGLIAAMVVFLIFGGVAAIVGAAGASHDSDALIAIPILGIIGTAIVLLIVILSVPSLIAGIGLLNFRPWARILTLIISAIDLLNVPIGTAIGVYGLWALLSPESERLFRRPAPAWRRDAA